MADNTKNYSYRPARYGVGNMGKISHHGAVYHTIKLYRQDIDIAKQHFNALKTARTRGLAKQSGQVAPIVPNPGNPNQFKNSTEVMGEGEKDPTSLAVLDPVVETHTRQMDFHYERAKRFMEAAMLHTELMKAMNLASSQEAKDMKSEIPPVDNTAITKLPAMFDFDEEDTHDFEKALRYHSQLHSEALMEAQYYRSIGEQVRDKMDKLNPEEPPETRANLQEAMNVLREMYAMWESMSSMHGMWASDYKDYLKRSADKTFGSDNDNNRDNPPQAGPIGVANPWAQTPTIQTDPV